jgi:hypothetical protein
MAQIQPVLRSKLIVIFCVCVFQNSKLLTDLQPWLHWGYRLTKLVYFGYLFEILILTFSFCTNMGTSITLLRFCQQFIFLFSPQEFLGPENIFFLFGAIAVLALVFVILNVPETKGLSLEEIESKILK